MRSLFGTLAFSGVGAMIGAGTGLAIWYLSYLPMRLDFRLCVMTGAVIGISRGLNEYMRKEQDPGRVNS